MTRTRSVTVVLVGVAVSAAGIASRHEGSPPKLLPESVPARNPLVTQQTVRGTICVPGWSEAIREPLPIKVREGYERDHAIPLQLGGAVGHDGRNVWYEAYPQARLVDVIENRLHREVCSGVISLRTAQRRIVEVKETQG